VPFGGGKAKNRAGKKKKKSLFHLRATKRGKKGEKEDVGALDHVVREREKVPI